MVTLTVYPKSTLVDEKISIEVVGLQPNSLITLRASATECGKTYDSCAHFQDDGSGYVHTNINSSLGGTYSGVQSMGLFTSMQPAPKEKRGTRLLKKDVTTPLITVLRVYNGFHTIKDFYKSSLKVLATTSVDRWYMNEDVERIPVERGNIRGILFKPKGPGPFPGIIDLFGGIARPVEFRSALLASHGFASLALQYFVYKDLPLSISKVTMDYFEEAVDWLHEQRFVISAGIGLVGVCTGGEIVLKMSTLFGQKIKACVSINGCPYHIPSHPTNKYKEQEGPTVPVYPKKLEYVDDAAIFLNYFPTSLPEECKDAMMKLENAECEYLLISGDEDKCWSGSAYAKQTADYLRSKDKNNWTVASYPGAGHLIEPPYSPMCSLVYMDYIDDLSLYGGQHDGHAKAQEDSWRKILEFLNKHVSKSVICEIKRSTRTNILPLALKSNL
ncbi:bile acid-CoA:amino acid N-acyltransferase-like [Antedon mediterranea]|uniref:bile acid-CoA:amino acid N-acyltransferase-like n=1 Tax=Antedon mediterranea TaxID=105859 RepID=UPI003AF78173